MYTRYISSIILNIEIYCADIVHWINEKFKDATFIRHRKIKITCTTGYRCFEFVMLVKIIAPLRMEQPVFW